MPGVTQVTRVSGRRALVDDHTTPTLPHPQAAPRAPAYARAPEASPSASVDLPRTLPPRLPPRRVRCVVVDAASASRDRSRLDARRGVAPAPAPAAAAVDSVAGRRRERRARLDRERGAGMAPAAASAPSASPSDAVPSLPLSLSPSVVCRSSNASCWRSVKPTGTNAARREVGLGAGSASSETPAAHAQSSRGAQRQCTGSKLVTSTCTYHRR